jgi:hypothetical protein
VEGEIMLCHILDERGGSEPWIPEKKKYRKKRFEIYSIEYF